MSTIVGSAAVGRLTACTLLFSVALAACGLVQPLPLSAEQQNEAATIVASTLQAYGTSAAPIETPILEITGNTNCRSGPGGSFDLVTAFTPGTRLTLVGRHSANNYWQVKIPNTEDLCWVWGEYAAASGDYGILPESAPVAGGGGVPARPGSFFYQYTCPFGNLTTDLSWGDSADNESGYRVFRFDQLLADLPANTTAYTDVVSVAPNTALQYSVEAYNSAGSSEPRTISFSCE